MRRKVPGMDWLALLSFPLVLLLAAAPAAAAELSVALSGGQALADLRFHQVGPNNAPMHHIFDALVHFDGKLQIQPQLAASWTLTDPQTWQFQLRKGVTFHNGEPFTANDVTYTLCRALALKVTGRTAAFPPISRTVASVEIPDDYTFVMHTSRADPIILVQLAALPIVSAAANNAGQVHFDTSNQCGLGEPPDVSDDDVQKIADGTGRYRLERYAPGDVVVLRANRGYYGPQPEWDRVIFRMVPNDASRVAGLLAGDYDLIENPSAQDLPMIKARGGFAWTITPSARLMFLQPDVGRAHSPGILEVTNRNPLQDARVREAVSLAIDRRTIANWAMDGMAVPADQYLPSGLFGSLNAPPKREYNPVLAHRLLAESGYANGFGIVLATTDGRYTNDVRVAQAIAYSLSKVGIRTVVDAMPPARFFPRRFKHEFSLSLAGWASGTGEASEILRYFVAGEDADRNMGGMNYGGYRSAEFDAQLIPAIEDPNDASRGRRLQQATLIALRDNALIPLYWETTAWAYKDTYTYTGRMDQLTDVDNLVPRR